MFFSLKICFICYGLFLFLIAFAYVLIGQFFSPCHGMNQGSVASLFGIEQCGNASVLIENGAYSHYERIEFPFAPYGCLI